MHTPTTYGIRPEEILDLGDYERQRDDIRRSAMQARALRRLAIGPNATLAFENRETIRYQILEMCRAERLARTDQVQHEIETYNEMLPSRSELAATLLLEFPENPEREKRLKQLLGLEEHLRFVIAGVETPASFDKRQIDVERLSSVQFVRFSLSDIQRAALINGERASVFADHPHFVHDVALSAALMAALATDLQEAGLGEN